MANGQEWLLLIHQVPPKPDYLRVKIRRRLLEIGAVAVKSTVYALPRTAQALEDFQWTLREITKVGGQGAICAAKFVGGLSDLDVTALFREARKADYAELARQARAVLDGLPRRAGPSDGRQDAEAALARMKRRLGEIRAIDFAQSPDAAAIDGLLRTIADRLAGAKIEKEGRAVPDRVRGRTWVTRKGVYVDRIACAWLIRRFIDPKAKFRFVADRTPKADDDELHFDMFDGEFTHEGDRCSFEVLLERFRLDDPALVAIGEIVHDLDMKDQKFRREETSGIEKVVAGIAMAHKADHARIERGSALLDDLHHYFARKSPKGRRS
jgi:hypothetical protein